MIDESHDRVYCKEFMVFYQPEAKDDAQLLGLDGGMKPQDRGSFIDKDDGRGYYCSRMLRLRTMHEEPQFFIGAVTFRRSPRRALCGNSLQHMLKFVGMVPWTSGEGYNAMYNSREAFLVARPY